MNQKEKSLSIQDVKTLSDENAFFGFSGPRWGSVQRFERAFWDVTHNPYFRHALMRRFVARNARGEPVGRAIGLIDQRRNRREKVNLAWIAEVRGWEFPDVRESLTDALSKWAQKRGARALHGPLSFGSWFELGHTQGQGSLSWVRYKIPIASLHEDDARFLKLEKKKQIGELSFIELSQRSLQDEHAWAERLPLIESVRGPGFFGPKDWAYFVRLKGAPLKMSIPALRFGVEWNHRLVGLCLAASDVSDPLDRTCARLLESVTLPDLMPHGVQQMVDLELMRRLKALGYQTLITQPCLESDRDSVKRYESLGGAPFQVLYAQHHRLG